MGKGARGQPAWQCQVPHLLGMEVVRSSLIMAPGFGSEDERRA